MALVAGSAARAPHCDLPTHHGCVPRRDPCSDVSSGITPGIRARLPTEGALCRKCEMPVHVVPADEDTSSP
jgi:hypothetical protein